MTKKEQMYALVAGRSTTDQTVARYCADHNISEAKYYYWQARWRASQIREPAAFVPITSIDPPAITVRLAGGLLLDFTSANLSEVADLLLEMDRRHALV